MEMEQIDQQNIADEVKEFHDQFTTTDFEKYSFFRLGQVQRKFWPHDVTSTQFKVPALTLNEWGLKNNEIIFELNQNNWIDPYSFYFQFYIQNLSDGDIQLDNSVHSLFSSIVIYINGNEVEKLENYPLLTKIYFDMTLGKKQRFSRRESEGFGLLEGGYGEKVINQYEKVLNKEKIAKEEKDGMCNVGSISQKKSFEMGVKFKMPFLSKFFGQRIEEKNWRLLPMRGMKMTIKLTTNKFGFFRPFSTGLSGEEIQRALTIDNIKIVKPQLCFVEYTFPAEFDQQLYNKYLGTSLFYDYIDYEVLDKYALAKETAELTLKFYVKQRKQGVRALFFIVTDASYTISNYARPLAYLNMGFSRFQIFTQLGNWPNDKYFEKWELFNGNKSCQNSTHPLLKEIQKLQTYAKGKETVSSENVFSEKSLARKWDITHLIARLQTKTSSSDLQIKAARKKILKMIQDFSVLESENAQKVDDINSKINVATKDIQLGPCNTMLVLKFDNVPKNNDTMVSGITLPEFKDHIIVLKKNEKSITTSGYEYLGDEKDMKYVIEDAIDQKQDIYKTTYIIGQIYKRAKMDIFGNITFIDLEVV